MNKCPCHACLTFFECDEPHHKREETVAAKFKEPGFYLWSSTLLPKATGIRVRVCKDCRDALNEQEMEETTLRDVFGVTP